MSLVTFEAARARPISSNENMVMNFTGNAYHLENFSSAEIESLEAQVVRHPHDDIHGVLYVILLKKRQGAIAEIKIEVGEGRLKDLYINAFLDSQESTIEKVRQEGRDCYNKLMNLAAEKLLPFGIKFKQTFLDAAKNREEKGNEAAVSAIQTMLSGLGQTCVCTCGNK